MKLTNSRRHAGLLAPAQTGSGQGAVEGVTAVEANTTVPRRALAYVAIQPCRLADARAIYGFTDPFGTPILFGPSPHPHKS